MNVNRSIKNLLSVIGSNIFVVLAGVIQSFILPKLMSPAQYGVWSMYLLYTSYAGFFNLGVSDGIYLIYGGQSYDSLDKKKFKTYLNIVTFYLSIFLLVWTVFQFSRRESDQFVIMLLIGVASFLACLINFTVSIDQASSRFSIYSKGHVIEKIFIMIGAVFLCIWRSALTVLIASIIGRVATVVYYYSNTKPILFSKHTPYGAAIRDILKFARTGIWVTLAAICITSMTGIGRFFIQNELGITELGYYSFVLSISGLFTIFFSAIATVLFPMLRQCTDNTYRKQISMMDNLLDIIGVLMLIIYYPASIIIDILYPQYEPAFKCLVVLFPLVLLQGRTSMIHFTVYKVERFERQYVYNLIVVMVLSGLMCFIGISKWPDIICIAIITYISYAIWVSINVFIYNKKSANQLGYHWGYILISVVYLIFNLSGIDKKIATVISIALLTISAIIYIIKQSSDLKEIAKKIGFSRNNS